MAKIIKFIKIIKMVKMVIMIHINLDHPRSTKFNQDKLILTYFSQAWSMKHEQLRWTEKKQSSTKQDKPIRAKVNQDKKKSILTHINQNKPTSS